MRKNNNVGATSSRPHFEESAKRKNTGITLIALIITIIVMTRMLRLLRNLYIVINYLLCYYDFRKSKEKDYDFN